MARAVAEVWGTVAPDGKIVPERKLRVEPGGRVKITADEEVAEGAAPAKESVWVILERIWADREARGMKRRSREDIDAEIRALREEWDEHQRGIEELQDRFRRERQAREC